jgi:hypothetical protein
MFKRVGDKMVNLSQIIFIELKKNKVLLTPCSKTLFSESITITSDTELEAKEVFEELAKEFGKK